MKVLLVFLMLVSANVASGKEWRGIVPLQSKRIDVEKALGPAKNPSQSDLTDYETADEQITVMYASGPPCADNGFRMWKVPRDTVISITIYPKKEVRFADLHLNERDYKKTDNQGHGPLYFYYTNEEDGIQYEITQGRVMSITYFAAAKDKRDLRCSTARSELTTSKKWSTVAMLP